MWNAVRRTLQNAKEMRKTMQISIEKKSVKRCWNQRVFSTTISISIDIYCCLMNRLVGSFMGNMESFEGKRFNRKHKYYFSMDSCECLKMKFNRCNTIHKIHHTRRLAWAHRSHNRLGVLTIFAICIWKLWIKEGIWNMFSLFFPLDPDPLCWGYRLEREKKKKTEWTRTSDLHWIYEMSGCSLQKH